MRVEKSISGFFKSNLFSAWQILPPALAAFHVFATIPAGIIDRIAWSNYKALDE